MDLPTRLREARAHVADLSARDLAELAGLSPSHITLIESGRRPRVHASTAAALCEVLGLSLDWLVSGKGPTPIPRRVRAAVETARRARPRAA